MSRYATGEPDAIDRARRVTALDAKMAGVMCSSFRCVCCGKDRKTEGRRQMVKGTNKFGYKCAVCVGEGK